MDETQGIRIAKDLEKNQNDLQNDTYVILKRDMLRCSRGPTFTHYIRGRGGRPRPLFEQIGKLFSTWSRRVTFAERKKERRRRRRGRRRRKEKKKGKEKKKEKRKGRKRKRSTTRRTPAAVRRPAAARGRRNRRRRSCQLCHRPPLSRTSHRRPFSLSISYHRPLSHPAAVHPFLILPLPARPLYPLGRAFCPFPASVIVPPPPSRRPLHFSGFITTSPPPRRSLSRPSFLPRHVNPFYRFSPSRSHSPFPVRSCHLPPPRGARALHPPVNSPRARQLLTPSTASPFSPPSSILRPIPLPNTPSTDIPIFPPVATHSGWQTLSEHGSVPLSSTPAIGVASIGRPRQRAATDDNYSSASTLAYI
ncbi:uncharacterized protein LOC144713986 [Wolffia australiana]